MVEIEVVKKVEMKGFWLDGKSVSTSVGNLDEMKEYCLASTKVARSAESME